MRRNLALATGLLGSTAGVLVAPAVFAQITEVTDVQVNAQNGGIEVILETTDGDRPQIFTVSRGNSLVADVINTQLDLPGGNGFLENDPAPGIASITVTQLDSNSIRVKVDGISTAPVGQVSQDNGQVVFNFNASGTASEPAAQEIVVEVPPPSISSPEPSVEVEVEVSQNPEPSTPEPLFEPQIEIDGLEARRRNLSNSFPTAMPRAIAPPVGDIAISALDPSPSTLILGTNEVIPRLVLRDAPVREVLSLLARAAGLNLAYTDPIADDLFSLDSGGGEEEFPEVTVSLDIENEPIQDVFNYVIRISGVEASRFGRTVFVSPRLPDSARNTVVRTVRLNQVSATDASSYLATLGAETRQLLQGGDRLIFDDNGDVTAREPVPPRVITVKVEPGNSPVLLAGLGVASDERLNSVTLIGTPRAVQLGMQSLQQLDARQRQVAVNVKIVDVDLLATENFGTSFSFALDNDDIFFSNDGGSASLIYGRNRPPTAAERNGSVTSPPTIAAPIPDGAETEPFFDFPPGSAPFNSEEANVVPNVGSIFSRPNFGTADNPFQPGVTEFDQNSFELSLPGLYQFPSRFLAALEAQVVNNNAKILTDPTLIVQEGQAATVQLTQEVVTNITVNRDTTAGVVSETTEFELADAGLTLGVILDRIDDNGFITLQVNPTVTSPTQTFDTGDGEITLLSTRNLQSGQVRLRDGQTLVLSGIISETDRTSVSKVPILGDLPIIGSLFRRTNRSNTRTEVVVLVTPEILDDSEFSNFGYGYVPQIETQQFINR